MSEIDTCIISYNLLDSIDKFSVHQTDWLPSNHAPISIKLMIPRYNLDNILSRACNLGGHGSLMGQVVLGRCGNRPLRFNDIDVSKFSNFIQNVPIPENTNNDADSFASSISKILYDCPSYCTKTNSEHSGAKAGL